jgi:radical SAM superfamily enzyme YgiQ (UPF0313 family)
LENHLKSLKIYLGDLTHDTVGLATEVFPLNVGLVGAYCKKKFGDAVEITLFKYIQDLENAIYQNPPDILALSNYPWCHNIDMAMLRLLASKRPEALRVLGGPNFPHQPNQQIDFLTQRPLIDIYPYLDGEVSFSNFVEFVLKTGSLEEARELLKTEAISGCAHLGIDGKLVAAPMPIRLKELDEIPSPYLMGLMDKFFDGRLSPMIQTNRGCPFSCTYCSDGTQKVSKVNHFSVDRVKAELEYIGQRVPKSTKALFISDLNFGMYTRDAEICMEIGRIKDVYDYPYFIDTTTGKNSKERVISNIEKLAGSLGMTMSVQSMTTDVLRNIKRENLRLDDFLGLKPAVQRVGLATNAEVILGLPGETKEGHIESIDKLLSLEMDHVLSYTLMMLNGTEMNNPEQRQKWGYKTKFRVIPRDFTALKSGENIVEVEEVAIESNTLPFEDYVFTRKFIIVLYIINNRGLKPLLRFLLQNKLQIKDLVIRMLNSLSEGKAHETMAPEKLAYYVGEFERETRDELWNSEEELVSFFQDPKNFNGLVDGTYGANLLQTYKAKIWGHCFEQVVSCAFAHAKELISDSGIHGDSLVQLEELEKYCRGMTFNLMGEDRLFTVPEVDLSYDIAAWAGDPDCKSLNEYAWSNSKKVRFILTEQQFNYLEENFKHFGRSDLGRGKVLIRISPNTLWRKAVCDLPPNPAYKPIPQFYQVPTAVAYRV